MQGADAAAAATPEPQRLQRPKPVLTVLGAAKVGDEASAPVRDALDGGGRPRDQRQSHEEGRAPPQATNRAGCALHG